MPGGVPGVWTGGVLPPPHATRVAASKTRPVNPKANFKRRVFVVMNSRKRNVRRAPTPGTIQGGLLNGPGTTPGAVVLTVSVLLPLVVMEVGFSVHVASIAAGVAQVRLTAPVNPKTGVTLMVAWPDPPGAEIVMGAELVTLVDKEKFAVTGTETAGEVEPV